MVLVEADVTLAMLVLTDWTVIVLAPMKLLDVPVTLTEIHAVGNGIEKVIFEIVLATKAPHCMIKPFGIYE